MLKLLISAAAGALIALPSMAATLTFGGTVTANDGQITSHSGAVSYGFSGVIPTGIVRSGDFASGSGSERGVRLAPDGDTGKYGFLQFRNGRGGFSFSAPAGQQVNYIGFDLGSVDAYDYFTFRDAAGHPITITSDGTTLGTEINGEQIAVADGISATTLLTNPPSLFVNFAFAANENVASVFVRQTNTAVELDNLAFATTAAASTGGPGPVGPPWLNVDAPGGTAIVAFGLIAVAGARRRRA